MNKSIGDNFSEMSRQNKWKEESMTKKEQRVAESREGGNTFQSYQAADESSEHEDAGSVEDEVEDDP